MMTVTLEGGVKTLVRFGVDGTLTVVEVRDPSS